MNSVAEFFGLRRNRVLHYDRIGAMSLPAGEYQITLDSSDTPGLNCSRASRDFTYFFDHDGDGSLPQPWTMNMSQRAFTGTTTRAMAST